MRPVPMKWKSCLVCGEPAESVRMHVSQHRLSRDAIWLCEACVEEKRKGVLVFFKRKRFWGAGLLWQGMWHCKVLNSPTKKTFQADSWQSAERVFRRIIDEYVHEPEFDDGDVLEKAADGAGNL